MDEFTYEFVKEAGVDMWHIVRLTSDEARSRPHSFSGLIVGSCWSYGTPYAQVALFQRLPIKTVEHLCQLARGKRIRMPAESEQIERTFSVLCENGQVLKVRANRYGLSVGVDGAHTLEGGDEIVHFDCATDEPTVLVVWGNPAQADPSYRLQFSGEIMRPQEDD